MCSMAEIIAVIPPPPAQEDREAMPPNDRRVSDQFDPEDIVSSPQVDGLCRYVGCLDDLFCYNPDKGFLQMQIRGRPQPQARSIRGRNRNMYSPTKRVQDQFSRIINLLFWTFTNNATGDRRLWGPGFLSVDVTFVFGSHQTAQYELADIDNMLKFVFDAMVTAMIFEDDRKIDKSSIVKYQVLEGCVYPELARTGGVRITVKLLR